MNRKRVQKGMAIFILLIVAVTFLLLWNAGGCEQPPATSTPVAPTVTVTPPPSPTPTATPTVIPQIPTLTHTPTLEPSVTPKPTHTAPPTPVWLEIRVPYDGSVWFRSCPSRGCVSIYPLNTIPTGDRVIFRQCANPAGFIWVEIYNGTIGYVYSDYVWPDICRVR